MNLTYLQESDYETKKLPNEDDVTCLCCTEYSATAVLFRVTDPHCSVTIKE